MSLDRLEVRRIGKHRNYVMPLSKLLEDLVAFLHLEDLHDYYSEMIKIDRANQGIHPEEAAILYGITRAIKPNLVLETGTFEGYSTAEIARALTNNGFGRVETVDQAKNTGSRVPESLLSVVTFHREIPSTKLVELWEHKSEKIDLFFHDSAHNYINTLEELATFSPFFNHGCVVVCHDAKMDFLDEFGVRKAVHEFTKAFQIEYIVLDTTCGLAIFRWLNTINQNDLSLFLDEYRKYLKKYKFFTKMESIMKNKLNITDKK